MELFQLMKRFVAVLALLLMGCGKDPVPIDPAGLARPLPALMVPPEPMIPVPPAPCESDPECRAGEYYAPSRAQCSAEGDKLIGLQRYVYSLHNEAPGAWTAEIKR